MGQAGAPPRGAPVLTFLAVLAAAVLIAVFGTSLARPSAKLAVLVYHHIEDPATSDVSCTPRDFAAQMSELLAKGFTPVRLDEAEAFLEGAGRGVKKPVLITFDDGYESLYQHALPVARTLGVPMTVFVVTSRIGLKPQFSRYLSRDQIREMAASGLFEFGSHTDDLHTDMMRIWNAFTPPPVSLASAVAADLERSRETLAGIVGTPPIAIAWPYGKFNRDTTQIALRAGMKLHFTSRSGYSAPGDDLLEIRRVPVTRRDTPATVVRKARGGWL